MYYLFLINSFEFTILPMLVTLKTWELKLVFCYFESSAGYNCARYLYFLVRGLVIIHTIEYLQRGKTYGHKSYIFFICPLMFPCNCLLLY
jgi:hypothetical protein